MNFFTLDNLQQPQLDLAQIKWRDLKETQNFDFMSGETLYSCLRVSDSAKQNL